MSEIQLHQPCQQLSAHEAAQAHSGPSIFSVLYRIRPHRPQDLYRESKNRYIFYFDILWIGGLNERPVSCVEHKKRSFLVIVLESVTHILKCPILHNMNSPLRLCIYTSGLGRLPGKNLVVVRREAALHAARTLGGDHRPGGQLREHADRGGQHWQDHSCVVPSYLRPCGRAPGAQWLDYLPTGKQPTKKSGTPVFAVFSVGRIVGFMRLFIWAWLGFCWATVQQCHSLLGSSMAIVVPFQ